MLKHTGEVEAIYFAKSDNIREHIFLANHQHGFLDGKSTTYELWELINSDE